MWGSVGNMGAKYERDGGGAARLRPEWTPNWDGVSIIVRQRGLEESNIRWEIPTRRPNQIRPGFGANSTEVGTRRSNLARLRQSWPSVGKRGPNSAKFRAISTSDGPISDNFDADSVKVDRVRAAFGRVYQPKITKHRSSSCLIQPKFAPAARKLNLAGSGPKLAEFGVEVFPNLEESGPNVADRGVGISTTA